MTKPLVYSLEPLHSEALSLARERFTLVLPGDSDFDTWRENAEGLMARNATVSAADVEVLAQNKLKFISKQGVGVDNFDLDALKKYNLPLMNTPGVNATAVAELALGLIMDVSRHITTIDRRIRRGDQVTKLDGWTGQTLRGRTLGVIGGGNIGLRLATMFHAAFTGPIIVFDPYLQSRAEWDAAITPGSLRIVTKMDKLLAESDVVSVHVPLTGTTRNMIASAQLKVMKPTSILINTARGGVINEADLLEELNNGTIFGAGLDAFVDEPPSLEKYEAYCQCDRVVLTPHIGAATASAQQETCRSMVEHLVEAFEGKTLRDRVV